MEASGSSPLIHEHSPFLELGKLFRKHFETHSSFTARCSSFTGTAYKTVFFQRYPLELVGNPGKEQIDFSISGTDSPVLMIYGYCPLIR
jgi:hypothetical protein